MGYEKVVFLQGRDTTKKGYEERTREKEELDRRKLKRERRRETKKGDEARQRRDKRRGPFVESVTMK